MHTGGMGYVSMYILYQIVCTPYQYLCCDSNNDIVITMTECLFSNILFHRTEVFDLAPPFFCSLCHSKEYQHTLVTTAESHA